MVRSGTINYCQIRHAYQGIYENYVSVDITNSAFSVCDYGILLYHSNPTIQYCNIHDNYTCGIYLSNSSPTLYNDNLITGNPYGVRCLTSSNPTFEGSGVSGNNNITNNDIGVSCNYNSLPNLGQWQGGNDLTNTTTNLQNISSGYISAMENYWGSMNTSQVKTSNPGNVKLL